MKKIKLVSAAAAALLAVSPLISSTVSVADISVNVTNGQLLQQLPVIKN